MGHTIIKPTPGKKRSVDYISNGNSTVILSQNESSFDFKDNIISYGDNIILAEANVILSLIGNIRATKEHSDVKILQESFINKIENYEKKLKSNNVNLDDLNIAKYSLCCTIDEIILNTKWGCKSSWSHNSLLSKFFMETQGGDKFFDYLNIFLSDPQKNIKVLEMMYLCLCLGFMGNLRIKENGSEIHRVLRKRIFKTISDYKGNKKEICNDLEKKIIINTKSKGKLSLWFITSTSILILTVIYMIFNYRINNKSDYTFGQVVNLLPMDKVENKIIGDFEVRDETQKIRSFLAKEIEMNLITVEELKDRTRITFKSSDLFSSGSAELVDHMFPLIAKIAYSLEATKGKIIVSGHTDDNPIFTNKYPSNWHLSLSRATALSDKLMENRGLHGRIIPEGMGSAQPIFTNDTKEGKARNRRVEIDLLFNSYYKVH